MLQDQLIEAICKTLSFFGIGLTDTVCDLVEQFVIEVLKQEAM